MADAQAGFGRPGGCQRQQGVHLHLDANQVVVDVVDGDLLGLGERLSGGLMLRSIRPSRLWPLVVAKASGASLTAVTLNFQRVGADVERGVAVFAPRS